MDRVGQYIKSKSGWLGVDLDATLAYYDGYTGNDIGEPIAEMVQKVKKVLEMGYEVRIFTARANDPQSIPYIEAWCEKHLGCKLLITSNKDYKCIEIWDDRAVQVVPNTGKFAGKSRLLK